MIEDHIPFDPDLLEQKAAGYKKSDKKLFQRLEKLSSQEVDKLIIPLHHDAMDCYDCLVCANCCKSISPAMSDRDVNRIAKHLRLKPSEVLEKYMEMDGDGDYVFRSQPCPFLGEDNYCSVYESRPKACREYPHTDRVKQQQLLKLAFRNRSVCPVVYEVVREISKR